ncbi:uncharacterized protein LOC120348130 [Styela clava]
MTEISQQCESGISQAVSIGVFHKSILCGVAINVLSQVSQQGPSQKKATPIKIRQALQMLQSESQILKKKRYFEIVIVMVKQDNTKPGIASHLCVNCYDGISATATDCCCVLESSRKLPKSPGM